MYSCAQCKIQELIFLCTFCIHVRTNRSVCVLSKLQHQLCIWDALIKPQHQLCTWDALSKLQHQLTQQTVVYTANQHQAYKSACTQKRFGLFNLFLKQRLMTFICQAILYVHESVFFFFYLYINRRTYLQADWSEGSLLPLVCRSIVTVMSLNHVVVQCYTYYKCVYCSFPPCMCRKWLEVFMKQK